ncbi:MAG: DUF5615 family PIN-like protein [Phycisphaeraceae bacterium]
MPVKFYMDVNVPFAITEQLRRRGIDVITAQEDTAGRLSDDELLRRASELGRVVFTHDHRFRAMAEQWIRDGSPFAGLAFGPMGAHLTGAYVSDLHLIAAAMSVEEWRNRVDYLPFK